MVTITLNGKVEPISQGTSLKALLRRFKLHEQSIAVALNNEVVPHSLHPITILKQGDVLEFVRAVSGG